MPQPMTPAPDARRGIVEVQDAGRMLAQAMAGMVSPVAGSPGAAAIAAIRAMLPGSGTFRQEYQRYNEAAAPDDSVMDRNPLPGESPWDFARRESASPAAMREVMQVASMAAPIVVHASPVKWSGQPTRAKAGTGEGGAAYGEGLYSSIPANAKGIDARYREQAAEFHRPVVRLDGVDLDTMSGDTFLMDALRKEFPKEVKPGQKIDAAGALQMARIKIEDKIAWAKREAERFKNSPDELNYYLNVASDYADSLDALSKLTPERFSVPDASGSFHVWDVPDTLLDWDAPLKEQPGPVLDALKPEVGPPVVHDASGWGALAPDGTSTSSPGTLGGRVFKWLEGSPEEARAAFMDTPGRQLIKGDNEQGRFLASKGIAGHRYLGEAGSSGEAQGVPNFVIYDDAAVKPLGTFDSADAFLQSDLYKQLMPRILREQAALVERYPHLKSYFDSQGR